MIPKHAMELHDEALEAVEWPHGIKPNGAYAIKYDVVQMKTTVCLYVSPFRWCRGGEDGEGCDWANQGKGDPLCPQLIQKEPHSTGRHCYLDHDPDQLDSMGIATGLLLLGRFVRYNAPPLRLVPSSVEIQQGVELLKLDFATKNARHSRFQDGARDAAYFYLIKRRQG